MNSVNRDKRGQEFKALFETYRVPVHNYVHTLTKDEEAARDITQELFLKLWERKDLADNVQSIEKYIFRMAHNASMHWFVKLGQDERLFAAVKQRMSSRNNNVLEKVDYSEALKTLAQAVDSLSPQRRKVYELSRNEGMKVPEIASELNLSTDTVKNHLKAALSHVREHFRSTNRDAALLMLIVWGLC